MTKNVSRMTRLFLGCGLAGLMLSGCHSGEDYAAKPKAEQIKSFKADPSRMPLAAREQMQKALSRKSNG